MFSPVAMVNPGICIPLIRLFGASCTRFTQGNVGGTSLSPVLRPKGGQVRVGQPRVRVGKQSSLKLPPETGPGSEP